MSMSKEKNPSFGGIKVRNDNAIDITLFCEICKLLLLHPIQLLCCGTRLCRWCSKRALPASEPFICPFCQTKQPKKQVHADRGVERELNTIKIQCYSCSWNGSYKDYKEHLQQYHADFECIDCHERFFAINSFEEHRQEICEYRCIPCGLPGCTELIKWSEMGGHYLYDKHQKLLIEFIIQYFFSKKPLSYISNRSTTTFNNDKNMDQELLAIQESANILSSGIETLSNDNIRLRSEHDQMKTTYERISPQINETKKMVDENGEKVNNYMQLQNETEKEVDDTKKLYLLTERLLLDNDGTRIFHFHKHYDDMNFPLSIYSPICKTSPFGYLFILRICSTIENEIENQGYLSIFISLLRGDFDQILFYPFSYNISFSLLDQSGQGKHIESTLKPDPKSPSFARPTSEKNDEVGIIKFCSLNYLRDPQSIYLKDGVFFIQTFIDFMNTGSIPFTRSLNDIT